MSASWPVQLLADWSVAPMTLFMVFLFSGVRRASWKTSLRATRSRRGYDAELGFERAIGATSSATPYIFAMLSVF